MRRRGNHRREESLLFQFITRLARDHPASGFPQCSLSNRHNRCRSETSTPTTKDLPQLDIAKADNVDLVAAARRAGHASRDKDSETPPSTHDSHSTYCTAPRLSFCTVCLFCDGRNRHRRILADRSIPFDGIRRPPLGLWTRGVGVCDQMAERILALGYLAQLWILGVLPRGLCLLFIGRHTGLAYACASGVRRGSRRHRRRTGTEAPAPTGRKPVTAELPTCLSI